MARRSSSAMPSYASTSRIDTGGAVPVVRRQQRRCWSGGGAAVRPRAGSDTCLPPPGDPPLWRLRTRLSAASRRSPSQWASSPGGTPSSRWIDCATCIGQWARKRIGYPPTGLLNWAENAEPEIGTWRRSRRARACGDSRSRQPHPRILEGFGGGPVRTTGSSSIHVALDWLTRMSASRVTRVSLPCAPAAMKRSPPFVYLARPVLAVSRGSGKMGTR